MSVSEEIAKARNHVIDNAHSAQKELLEGRHKAMNTLHASGCTCGFCHHEKY